MINKKVELLAPAGDLERLKINLLYGADAVYFGGKQYSLRANASNFGLEEIKEADLIIFSMGSLYTSILPNIICKDVKRALDKSTAPIMYLCNIVTQPGETDDFTVGDHVKLLNRYLNKKKVNVVIANNEKI